MNLAERYNTEIRPKLMSELGIDNIMAVPRLTKVALNMGVGEAVGDRKILDFAVGDLTAIAGQKVVITKARKSEAGFKIREGWPVGCMVTLRAQRMYEFIDRLIGIALPRTRDFRGLNPKGFDGRGNYNMGITEQIIFAEIDYDKIDKVRGMNITICTTAKTDEEARALLEGFEMPFQK